MKKLFLVLGLVSIFLNGCATNDIALKEKCSKFNEEAKKRSSGFSISYSESYSGTFFSRTQNTCISKYVVTYRTKPLNTIESKYYDELTGHYIAIPTEFLKTGADGMPYMEFWTFEKSLNLIE